MEKKNKLLIDRDLVARATEKAKKANIAKNMVSLFNYLLSQVITGKMKIVFDANSYNWTADEYTFIRYDSEKMDNVKDLVRFEGLKPTNSFVVSLLLSNYINYG